MRFLFIWMKLQRITMLKKWAITKTREKNLHRKWINESMHCKIEIKIYAPKWGGRVEWKSLHNGWNAFVYEIPIMRTMQKHMYSTLKWSNPLLIVDCLLTYIVHARLFLLDQLIFNTITYARSSCSFKPHWLCDWFGSDGKKSYLKLEQMEIQFKHSNSIRIMIGMKWTWCQYMMQKIRKNHSFIGLLSGN